MGIFITQKTNVENESLKAKVQEFENKANRFVILKDVESEKKIYSIKLTAFGEFVAKSANIFGCREKFVNLVTHAQVITSANINTHSEVLKASEMFPVQEPADSGVEELWANQLIKPQSKIEFKEASPLEKFTTEQIHDWLFDGLKDLNFPKSKLATKQAEGRKQAAYAPKTTFSEIAMQGTGKYTSRIGIYNGGVTDIKADSDERAAVGDSNNGDLLTGCGYAVATAIINAAGPNLQRDLYNKFGVPGVMEVSKYGKENYGHTEGRGYAISCDAYDMKKTHNIERVEFMTVPMHNVEGVRNMYAEAFEHSKDLDFIIMPMAGMSHPVLSNNPKLSAQIATEEFKKFVNKHPASKLKVVFTIFNNKGYEDLYAEAAKKL